MKKNIIWITILVITVGLIYSIYEYVLLNDISNKKTEKIISLESKNKDLTEKIEKLPKYTTENKNYEKIKLEKEKVNLEEEIKILKENKIDFKLVKSYKVSTLNIGDWNLTNKEKEDILKSFNKDKSFYEILPIVDNNLYKNDPDSLKQLGLSRKRASSAVILLRSLNPNNKIFISTEVIYEENERGFIINQFN